MIEFPWREQIEYLVSTQLAAWPYDDEEHPLPCAVVGCHEAIDSDGLLVPGGVVHEHHELGVIIPLMMESEYRTPCQEVIRLAGWEVAHITTHPSGARSTVEVQASGKRPATEARRIETCMELWGFPQPTGWDAAVEALADRIAPRRIA